MRGSGGFVAGMDGNCSAIGSIPSCPSAYMRTAMPSCLRLLRQAMLLAFSFDFAAAGKSNEARIAMMAITTSSSIRVKALGARREYRKGVFIRFSKSNLITTHHRGGPPGPRFPI